MKNLKKLIKKVQEEELSKKENSDIIEEKIKTTVYNALDKQLETIIGTFVLQETRQRNKTTEDILHSLEIGHGRAENKDAINLILPKTPWDETIWIGKLNEHIKEWTNQKKQETRCSAEGLLVESRVKMGEFKRLSLHDDEVISTYYLKAIFKPFRSVIYMKTHMIAFSDIMLPILLNSINNVEKDQIIDGVKNTSTAKRPVTTL